MSRAGDRHRRGSRHRTAGYTYASMLILLAATALAAQTAVIPAGSARIRNAEAELIFRGLAYRDAIDAFRDEDIGTGRLPRTLADLLTAPPGGKGRYIRRLYSDPISGAGWTPIRVPGGGIIGVAPSSTLAPRQTAFFPPGLDHFGQADRYSDWIFSVEDR